MVNGFNLVTTGLIHCAGFVILGNFENQGLARFVHSEQLYFCAFTAKFQDNTVERVDCRQIPEVRLETSIRTVSTTSRKSKASAKLLADTKNSCPRTV